MQGPQDNRATIQIHWLTFPFVAFIFTNNNCYILIFIFLILCWQMLVVEVHNSWSNVGLHVEGHRRWNRAKTHSRTLHHHFSFPYPLQILKTKRYTLLFPINRYSKKGMLNGDRKVVNRIQGWTKMLKGFMCCVLIFHLSFPFSGFLSTIRS